MMRSSPGRTRALQRLALAGVLVVIVGISLGLDGSVAVALCLTAMEIDAYLPQRRHP